MRLKELKASSSRMLLFIAMLVLSTNRNTLSQTPVDLNNNDGGSVVDRSYALPALHSHKVLSMLAQLFGYRDCFT